MRGINKKRLVKNTISIVLAVLIASIINGYLINSSDSFRGTLTLYTAKLGEHAQFSLSFHTLLVYLRNFLIPLFRNFTILVVIFGFISLIILFLKNKRLFFLSALWLAPSFIANQWWDSLLYGRHALISGFGLAFLAAYLLKKSKMGFLILSIFLLIVSLPAINLLKEEIPYLRQTKFVKQLSNDGLLIESHFARPQVDNQYKRRVVFVDEPGWEKGKLITEINGLLKNSKPVFVTAQALPNLTDFTAVHIFISYLSPIKMILF